MAETLLVPASREELTYLHRTRVQLVDRPSLIQAERRSVLLLSSGLTAQDHLARRCWKVLLLSVRLYHAMKFLCGPSNWRVVVNVTGSSGTWTWGLATWMHQLKPTAWQRPLALARPLIQALVKSRQKRIRRRAAAESDEPHYHSLLSQTSPYRHWAPLPALYL